MVVGMGGGGEKPYLDDGSHIWCDTAMRLLRDFCSKDGFRLRYQTDE